MSGRLSTSTSMRRPLGEPSAATTTPRMPPSSSLKRSLQSSGLGSDLVTPSLKRRAYADPTPKAPTSIDRIQAEQERRTLLSQLSALQRELVEAQATARDVQTSLRERDARVARLERDREQIAERELEARKSRREAEDHLRASREAAERDRDDALAEASEANDRADRATAEARRATHEAEQARSRATGAVLQADTLQAELEKCDDELEKARLAIDTAERERDDLTAENEDLRRRIRDGGGGGPDGVDELRIVREELHRQVTHLKTLEGANARLTRELSHHKAKAADATILREQVHSLEAKLKLTDQLRRRLAAAEADVESLRSQQDEWQAYLRADDDNAAATTSRFDSPRSIGRALAAARLEVVGLQDRLGQRAADLKARDALVGQLEARLDDLDGDLRIATEALAQAEAKRAREGRMTDLVRREADMLREQLRTYAVEEKALGSAEGGRAEAIAGLDEVLDAHKRELADAVREAERLRGMLEAAGGNTTRLDGEATSTWRQEGKLGETLAEALKTADTLREELAEANREVEMAVKEVASLEATVERLSKAVGRGEYDRSMTRVLELVDNPSAQDLAVRTATLDALRAENAALLARLESLPAASSSSTPSKADVKGMVPKETLEALRKDKEALEVELENVGKKSARLKETFNVRANDFRSAIYSLLGYRVDFRDGGRIRLTSMFAPSKEDYLIFEPTTSGPRAGTMQLLGGTGEAEWAKKEPVKGALEFWVSDRQCIPGFLSTLTLEGYEQATRGGKHLGFTQG